MAPLVGAICVRNMRLYWTKSVFLVPWVPGIFVGDLFMYFYNKYYRSVPDPYDLTIAWKDFEKRAEIARKLAERDVNKDDFIHPDNEFAFITEEDVEDEIPVPPQLETYKDMLDKAKLDVGRMCGLEQDVLNSILKEVGINIMGDRIDIIKYIHDLSERQLRKRRYTTDEIESHVC